MQQSKKRADIHFLSGAVGSSSQQHGSTPTHLLAMAKRSANLLVVALVACALRLGPSWRTTRVSGRVSMRVSVRVAVIIQEVCIMAEFCLQYVGENLENSCVCVKNMITTPAPKAAKLQACFCWRCKPEPLSTKPQTLNPDLMKPCLPSCECASRNPQTEPQNLRTLKSPTPSGPARYVLLPGESFVAPQTLRTTASEAPGAFAQAPSFQAGDRGFTGSR